ncbi:MAG: YjbQ family protein [Gammaproteobacteria bacterium]|nr:YjbQ family protein [Gammaproteobacteria bacterium]
MWLSRRFSLSPQPRGFHLITEHVVHALPEISNIHCGLLHLQLLHTSASLTLNENADPTVRSDLDKAIDHIAPERQPFYRHTYEGDDDMPAHIKSSILGVSITVPIENGLLVLGTWQGIYLGEHRNHGGSRQIHAVLQGE